MRICNYYTETPRYQRCSNAAIEGSSHCAEHQQPTPVRAGELSDAVKNKVREQYGHVCAECGAPAKEVDHIVPLAEFSPGQKHLANLMSNLQLLCETHHKRKTAEQLRAEAERNLNGINFYDTSTSARNRKKKRRRAQGIWYK